MNKMCGNCGKTDHKYIDCPYVDMQFPLTKKEYTELKEKASKWDNLKGESIGFIKAFNWLQENEISKIPSHPNNIENQKLRELIEDDLKNCDWSDGGEWNFHLNRLQTILEESKK